MISVQRSDGVFLLERDTRRRGAFSLYWDSNAFALLQIGVSLVMVRMLCYLLNMISRQMKYLPYKNLNYRFDFEIGYFIKSPCRKCEKRKDFPECMDDCNILDKIHSILCESISCSRRF